MGCQCLKQLFINRSVKSIQLTKERTGFGSYLGALVNPSSNSGEAMPFYIHCFNMPHQQRPQNTMPFYIHMPHQQIIYLKTMAFLGRLKPLRKKRKQAKENNINPKKSLEPQIPHTTYRSTFGVPCLGKIQLAMTQVQHFQLLQTQKPQEERRRTWFSQLQNTLDHIFLLKGLGFSTIF